MSELNAEGTISRQTFDMFDLVFGDDGDNPATLLRAWFLDEMPDRLRKLEETVCSVGRVQIGEPG